MSETNGRTVFVLGAGFTKAFLPTAPLLVDDYGADALCQRFSYFGFPTFLVRLEMKQPDHPPGWVNLERLMTRLHSEMPHDHRTGSREVFALMSGELFQTFRARLDKAKDDGLQNIGELRLFAGHCVGTKSTCITFNYDDVLDEALWMFNPSHNQKNAWNPDSGYGFPCRMSESCVRDTPAAVADPEATLLLKLHGSLNWRVPLGYPKPYVIEAVRHHEAWFEHYGYNEKIGVQRLERFLELGPMIIPPVMTKAELNEQPVLRLIWESAIEALKKAERVVFLGYSLPMTDIAASFLIREGLDHLPAEAVTVVDYARTDGDRVEKVSHLLRSYRNVSPHITEERFQLCGAVDWIRENLTRWLYNSKGQPIAIESLGWIVSKDHSVVGSRCRKTEVWGRGEYRGEVVDGNRLLCRTIPPTDKAMDNVEPPPLPRPGTPPRDIRPFAIPDGYMDLLDS